MGTSVAPRSILIFLLLSLPKIPATKCYRYNSMLKLRLKDGVEHPNAVSDHMRKQSIQLCCETKSWISRQEYETPRSECLTRSCSQTPVENTEASRRCGAVVLHLPAKEKVRTHIVFLGSLTTLREINFISNSTCFVTDQNEENLRGRLGRKLTKKT